MAESKRLLKLAKEIKEHIANMLVLGHLADERLRGLVITHVKVSPDVRIAKVYYCVPNDKINQKEDIQSVLSKASGFIRHDLAQSLMIRHTPLIHFYFDDSIDYMSHISGVFRAIKEE
jgi:ribosome-binding factor A